MSNIYVVHSGIADTTLAIFSFIWGWLTGGTFLKLLSKVAEMIAMYYIQKSLREGHAPTWVIHLEHSLHNHKGMTPTNCVEGKCSQSS